MTDENRGDERRNDPREAMILRVDYGDSSGLIRDVTENVSAGGIFVRTDRILPIGHKVRLALSFPGLLSPVEIEGLVARQRPATSDYPAGIGLSVASENDRRKLRDLVNAASAPQAPRRYRVLLVEDNPYLVQMYTYGLKRLFREGGETIELFFAANGHEALGLIAKETPDLVVTDLYMPVLDGFALIERIRQNEQGRHTPVLVMSAGGKDAELRAMAAGADVYLNKPVRFVDILQTIRNLVNLGAG